MTCLPRLTTDALTSPVAHWSRYCILQESSLVPTGILKPMPSARLSLARAYPPDTALRSYCCCRGLHTHTERLQFHGPEISNCARIPRDFQTAPKSELITKPCLYFTCQPRQMSLFQIALLSPIAQYWFLLLYAHIQCYIQLSKLDGHWYIRPDTCFL